MATLRVAHIAPGCLARIFRTSGSRAIGRTRWSVESAKISDRLARILAGLVPPWSARVTSFAVRRSARSGRSVCGPGIHSANTGGTWPDGFFSCEDGTARDTSGIFLEHGSGTRTRAYTVHGSRDRGDGQQNRASYSTLVWGVPARTICCSPVSFPTGGWKDCQSFDAWQVESKQGSRVAAGDKQTVHVRAGERHV